MDLGFCACDFSLGSNVVSRLYWFQGFKVFVGVFCLKFYLKRNQCKELNQYSRYSIYVNSVIRTDLQILECSLTFILKHCVLNFIIRHLERDCK